MTEKKKAGIYIHIPFCERKCKYCGFLSFDNKSPEAKEEYVDALIREIETLPREIKDNYCADTIYIGGGTPSILDSNDVVRILESLGKNISIQGDAECTIEVNPGTVDEKKLCDYRTSGINRLSIGVQSFDDGLLQNLGRIHKKKDAIDAYDTGRLAGFDNISLDLMFAIPSQSQALWEESLREAIKLAPEHISFYSLQLEEGTPFYKRYKDYDLSVADDETERNMYRRAIALTCDAGYKRYEISNTARHGYECRHNMKYWNMDEFLGLGLGAHSYINGSRGRNLSDMKEYTAAVNSGGGTIDFGSYAAESKKEAMAVYCFTALRKSDGIDLSGFEKRFGKNFFVAYRERIDDIMRYKDEGFLELRDNKLYLTDRGIDVSNSIMSEFV